MLTFLAAMMVVFFFHTSPATIIVVGTVLCLLLGMTVSLVWLDWEGHSEYHEQSISYSSILGAKAPWKYRLDLKFRRMARSTNASTGSSDGTAVSQEG